MPMPMTSNISPHSVKVGTAVANAAASTVSVAVAPAGIPLCEMEDRMLVVPVFTPGVVPVTLKLMAQLVLAPTLPPTKVMLVAPALAVRLPLHVLLDAGGVETTSPAGNASENPRPVRGVPPPGPVFETV